MESLIAALALALLHAGASALRFLDRIPRSRWLSAAGGIALAYVFVHLLPELADIQSAVDEAGVLAGLERHTYLVALAGVATFYVLEQLARHSGGHSAEGAATSGGSPDDRAGRARREIGWIHLASYGLYNTIIGYVLVERQHVEDASLWPFAFAMGVHFLVNDHGLRQHHGALYHRVGRWLVSAAVLGGWALGQVARLDEAALGLPLAFIAGGVILNVLKEELPEERQSRLLPFVAAAVAYTAVLLAV
ncbi:MAG: ZIP family metal transporter [Actinomycetota bacterium]|nr:ZIP family metal transporter [Actinomycetota bacterium]